MGWLTENRKQPRLLLARKRSHHQGSFLEVMGLWSTGGWSYSLTEDGCFGVTLWTVQ